MSFGQTPISTTPLSTNQFPVSAVAVPNEAGGNLTALEGGPETTDTNGNKTAPVSMYVKDGGNVTQGTSTDANTVNSIMGRLTKIRDLLNATLTVGGTITEANSASIKADLDAINTSIGAISDAAWSGSGSGSEIAILKKIVAELAATLTVSGTVTANAGTGTFTNQQSNVTTDYDTGAGTQNLTMFGVALPASGGAVSGGTSTNPIRTDPTGTTTQPVNGTVTVQQATAANLKVDLSGTSANSTAIKVDGSGVTQPVSGTVTANIGTTNGVALDTSVNGVIVAQGSTTSGEKGPLVQGAVTTSAPTYTTAQTSPISLTTTGAVRVDNSAVTQPVSGTVTANAGTGSFTVAQSTGSNLHAVLDAGSAVIGHVIADSGSTTSVTQATASNLNAQVVGSVASGASNAGNPVKDGGVFNTTQPTVTTGQVVDAQYSARGAAIVATGVDAFAVNASQSGTWNVTNVSGTVSLPTGASTSAKQPALGTAGSASSDVLTVQGVASMTAIKTDGSGVTQPVSGTVTANAGTGIFNDASVGSTGSSVPASASYVGGNKGGNLAGISLDGSGNLNVNVAAGGGSGGTSSSFNSTFPSTGTAVGASDGTNMKSLQVDGSGFLKVNVSAGGGSGGTSSSFGSALPATGTSIGFTDGTNMQAGKVFDADTGAGTEYLQGVILRKSASGGSVEAATTSNPLRTDPTGTTTQPVSGTVSITANSSVNVAQVAGTTTDTNSGNKSAGTQRIVLATDQPQLTNALKVDGSGVTQPVSGTVTANAGTGTFTNQQSNITTDYDTGAGTQTMTMFGLALPASGGSVAGGTATNPVQVSLANTAANSTAVKVDGSAVTQPVSGTVSITANSAVNVAQINGVTTSMGNGISGTGVQRVTIASDSTGQVTLATGTNTIGALTANQSVNVAQIAGSTTSTAATGVQKVGIVGNGGATVDSTIGAGTSPTNAVVTGSVYNSSAPAPTSGQAMALQSDQAGNVRTFPGIALAALSAWNSGTSLNATQTIFTNSGAESVLVQLTQTTTLTAGAVTFEVTYDGSIWSTIPASAVLDPTSTTFAQISLPYTVQASTNKTFLLNMNGAQGLRVKLSTQITGSGSVTPNYALLPASPADTVIALSPTAANFNVTASAGTNLNTSLLALESGGNLATLAGGIASSKYQTNVAQLAGTTTDTNSGNKSAGTLRIVLATDQPALTNAQPANITQVAGNAVAVGNNAVPVLNSAATGYVSAFGSNAAALTSSTDYSFKWGAGGTTQVNHVMIQNNTTANLNFDLDVAANAGSPILAPGQTLFFDVQTTATHLFQAGTPNVNGSSAGNIVVRGWL